MRLLVREAEKKNMSSSKLKQCLNFDVTALRVRQTRNTDSGLKYKRITRAPAMLLATFELGLSEPKRRIP